MPYINILSPKYVFLIYVILNFTCFDNKILAAEDVQITLPRGIESLHLKGLSGKGVKVALLDTFEFGGTHGRRVEAVLKKVAPEVDVIRVETDWEYMNIKKSKETSQLFKIYAENKSKVSLKLKLLNKIKADSESILSESSASHLPGYYKAYDYNKEETSNDFEEFSFIPGSKLILNLLEYGPLAELFYDNQYYYASMNQFSQRQAPPKDDFWSPSGQWTLTVDADIGTSEIDEQFAKVITDLVSQGITIINYSKTLMHAGSKTAAAIKEFSDKGGIWVSAAGNESIIYSNQIQVATFNNNMALLLNTSYISLLLSDSFLVVGALIGQHNRFDYKEEFAPYSARAGIIKDNFLVALVEGTMNNLNKDTIRVYNLTLVSSFPEDETFAINTIYLVKKLNNKLKYKLVAPNGKVVNGKIHMLLNEPLTPEISSDIKAEILKQDKLSGTSFAAPEVSGAIALLHEAYPQCTPKKLAQALRSTAINGQRPHSILQIGSAIETGLGALNPEGAYNKAKELCS